MRPPDLDLHELLELAPDDGLIRFAGQRALLLDAAAVGLMRRYVAQSFSPAAAKDVFARFGYAQGWRLADTLRTAVSWDSDAEWRDACLRLPTLQGMLQVDPASGGPLSPEGLTLQSCHEAEQHLLHFGRAATPACWTVAGLISGYLSRASSQPILVIEDQCVACGDSACHFTARTREAWGVDQPEAVRLFDGDGLDASLHVLTAALKAADARRPQPRRPIRASAEREEPLGIIARSEPMRQVVDLARRVARVDSTVLITGESGAGKERIARLVHDQSGRASGPFIAVNCGAIPESLLESELFGHVRGAFTGATQDRAGLFEAAHTGTLLLDEVGEVSPGMQVKLLRVLQERELRRVGENRSRHVDVRVVAATNRDLAHGVSGGAFRQDLYYRLKVVELHVPPLRQRHDDVLPLARVLLATAALRMKVRIEGLAPAVADQLLRYAWPGNVRELENAMERAVALARGSRVELEDLPEEIRLAFNHPRPAPGSVRPLSDVERDYIVASLEVNAGNQTRTAAQLGIGTATLYRKLRRYAGHASPAGVSPGPS